jgi:hypothetical protein
MNRHSDLSTFFHHYIKALRWAEQFEGRISDEDRAHLKEMCRQFLKDSRELIEDEPGMGLDRAGHDFYLTHVGHGAGFWDGDWPKHGDELTALAEEHPRVEATREYLYVPHATTA